MKKSTLNKRKNTPLVYSLFLFVFLVISYAPSFAKPTPSMFNLMSHTEVLDLTIETNWEAFDSDRRKGTEYPAAIHFKDQYGQSNDWLLKVSIRGNFRRMECPTIPPLKLNFKKKELAAAGLAKFDDYKLVTHCVKNPVSAKELVLKEFLVYKLYNSLTENSFRVQLLNITFKDTKTGKIIQQSGFLIEDTAELRNRIGAEKVKQKYNLPIADFQQDKLRQLAIFQYAIGNTDWRLNSGRNLKFVQKEGAILAIPYDFDFSIFVDAPYSTIDSNIGAKSKYDRIYLGCEEVLPNLNPALGQFKEQQPQLLQIIADFKLLKEKTRKRLQNYLNRYFNNYQYIKWPTYRLTVKVGN